MEKGNFEKEPNIENKQFEDFQQEIKEIQDKELERKKSADNPELVGNPDLLSIEVDKLTQDDMEMWQTYKKLNIENITHENIQDFKEYRNSTNLNSKLGLGRKSFVRFLANKLNVLWVEKWIEK